MEQVTVPKVEMVKETVVVPDVRIERQHKMMPVTVTKLVPVQKQEVVMRCISFLPVHVLTDIATARIAEFLTRCRPSETGVQFAHQTMFPLLLLIQPSCAEDWCMQRVLMG